MPISRSDAADPRSPDTSVLVVGAGPAGLAAAVAAGEVGARVVLVDAEAGAGRSVLAAPPWGRRGGAAAPPGRRVPLARRPAAGVAGGRRLIEYLDRHQVWAVEPLTTASPCTLTDRRGRTPVARESGRPGGWCSRPAPTTCRCRSPGGICPGCSPPAGPRRCSRATAWSPAARVLVAGTGPFLLPVAAGLAAAGATVVGVHEAGAGVIGGARMPVAVARQPRRRSSRPPATRHRWPGTGCPYRTRSTVRRRARRSTARLGDRRAAGRPVGRPRADKATRVEVDTLAVGWGFVPQLELPLALGCAHPARPGRAPGHRGGRPIS